MNSINVWVGNFGDYKIPDIIIARAKDLNKGKLISDRRTKGFKILKVWGESTDHKNMLILNS